MKITIERLREALSFDSETGSITWNQTGPGKRPDKIAGSLMKIGYLAIGLDGSDLYAHRVAWALFYGEWPEGQIDHINGIKSDNRISNLRIATYSENARNKPAYRNSKSGIKGVSWSHKYSKWRATISLNGKYRHIGYFKNTDDAAEAYQQAAIQLHGEFAKF